MAEAYQYDDIIHLTRPHFGRHARMSMADRGAQFAPFAALVGYEAVIEESARRTEEESILDEHSKELLDRRLRYIAGHPEQTGNVTVLCFRRDGRKPGGSYVSVTGKVKRIEACRGTVVMDSGEEIEIECIHAIDSEEWWTDDDKQEG